jgi:hypothetical protein
MVMKSRCLRALVAMCLVSTLIACGGGGGGGGFVAQNASPGGLWQGSITIAGTTDNIFALVTEAGDFQFIQSNGSSSLSQYFGKLVVSGTHATASFTGVPFPGTTFADGSIQGSGTLTATVQERSQITFDATFTTANNTVTNASATMTYSKDYETASSLATISGNFTSVVPAGSPPATDVLSINSAGVLMYDDTAATGCKANGTVSIIDSRYDLYAVEFTFASCTATALNGLQLTGLASIDRTSSPALLLFATHGTLQGAPVGLLLPFQST